MAYDMSRRVFKANDQGALEGKSQGGIFGAEINSRQTIIQAFKQHFEFKCIWCVLIYGF